MMIVSGLSGGCLAAAGGIENAVHTAEEDVKAHFALVINTVG